MSTVLLDKPPLVVGSEEQRFLITHERSPLFWCPIHTPPNEFPFVTRPIWRGEVPEGASCEQCGLPLTELE